MRYVKYVVLALMLALLTGCYGEIPPGYKGKLLGPNGYSEEVYEPGRTWVGLKESLVLLDTSTNVQEEVLTVKSADGLDLGFDVRVAARIGGSDSVINAMFNDVREVDGEVAFAAVYNVYLRPAVRSAAREVVSQYNIEDVAKNYARVSQELRNGIEEKTAAMPVDLVSVSLGEVRYPPVITNMIDAAKERQLEQAAVAAERETELMRKEAQLELEEKQAEIEAVKARAIAEQNRIVAEGLSPELIEYRRLEVQESMAGNLGNEGSVVFFPYSDKGSVGMENRIYGTK